jgi:hypothetical protein
MVPLPGRGKNRAAHGAGCVVALDKISGLQKRREPAADLRGVVPAQRQTTCHAVRPGGRRFLATGPADLPASSLWWWRLGIRVEFVRRGSINNNAHEQMHGVMKNELVIADTARAQARSLQRWTTCYNCEGPNEAIGLRTPASVYHPRPGPLPKLYPPRYPRSWWTRVVQGNGTITLRG